MANNEDLMLKLIGSTRQSLNVAIGKLDEIEALMSENPTPGREAKRLLDNFVAGWNAKYRGQKYIVNGAKDIAMLKRLLKSLSAAEIVARMVEYLKSTEPFYESARHTLPVFVGAVNKFGAGYGQQAFDDDAGLVDTPPDCRHTPFCKSDQEHTRRNAREARGQS